MHDPQHRNPERWPESGTAGDGTARLPGNLGLWQHARNFFGRVEGLFPLLVSVAAFALYKLVHKLLLGRLPEALPIIMLAFAALAVAFRRLDYRHVAPSHRMLLRGICVILGSYAALASVSLSPAEGSSEAQVLALLNFLRAAAVASAAIAWFRPAFAAVTAAYVITAKDIAVTRLGFPPLSQTDYLPVVELGIYLSLGLICFHWLCGRGRAARCGREEEFSFLLFITAVAVHFGNYLWSAIAKLRLDGGPLSWVIENRTSILMVNSSITGHLPISQWPALSSWIFSGLDSGYVLFNAITLLLQLFCLFAITRIRLAILVTLAYDVSHIVIYLTTGIFFWKWILLNLLIVAALVAARDRRLSVPMQVVAMLFVACGTLVFFAARLGWYDSRALNNIQLLAVTDDGHRYIVPTNYFLTASVTFAQQRIGNPGPDAYPTGTWGYTKSVELLRAGADDCRIRARPAARRSPDAGLAAFIRRHHDYVLSRVDSSGILNYDLYPHHILSNPFEYRDFYRLDKRRIVKYIYSVDKICVAPSIDPAASRLVEHHEHEIAVR